MISKLFSLRFLLFITHFVIWGLWSVPEINAQAAAREKEEMLFGLTASQIGYGSILAYHANKTFSVSYSYYISSVKTQYIKKEETTTIPELMIFPFQKYNTFFSFGLGNAKKEWDVDFCDINTEISSLSDTDDCNVTFKWPSTMTTYSLGVLWTIKKTKATGGISIRQYNYGKASVSGDNQSAVLFAEETFADEANDASSGTTLSVTVGYAF